VAASMPDCSPCDRADQRYFSIADGSDHFCQLGPSVYGDQRAICRVLGGNFERRRAINAFNDCQTATQGAFRWM